MKYRTIVGELADVHPSITPERIIDAVERCMTTLDDQQLAGLIMKIGAGLLLWAIIAVVFFRWASEEERTSTPRRGLVELDRELTQMGLRR